MQTFVENLMMKIDMKEVEVKVESFERFLIANVGKQLNC